MNETSDNYEPTELARRTNDGLEILLLWDRRDDALRIVVSDRRAGVSFELAADDGQQALDVFYHPFAYHADRKVPRHARLESEA